jgi:hypothetical protein
MLFRISDEGECYISSSFDVARFQLFYLGGLIRITILYTIKETRVGTAKMCARTAIQRSAAIILRLINILRLTVFRFFELAFVVLFTTAACQLRKIRV